MATAFIGLGSNLGDREANLRFALERLTANPELQRVRCSSFYETAPVGPVEQDDFLNAVAELETAMAAEALLALLLQIEQEAGRKRDIRWGPRTLDLDLLDYDGQTIQTASLKLPHPEAHRRAFVLAPWAELTPEWPLADRRVADWLKRTNAEGVRKTH